MSLQYLLYSSYLRPLLFTIIACLIPIQLSWGSVTALVGEQFIDGIQERAQSARVILIEGDKIVGITDSAGIPADATIIKLSGATLLPGLIDSHAHPLISGDDYQNLHIQQSSAYKALKAYKGLERLLAAGWTTVRVAGDADIYYGNQDIKKLIDEGVLSGPRIFGAAHYLSITGGGGDINYFSPEQKPIADGLIVDGVDEIRKAIRTEAKYGADWIKVLVTGAFMSVGDSPRSVQFSEEEFRAVIDEARRQDMPVMAHAHATEGINMAVKLGARSIEHGTYLDDESIKLMRQYGTYLVPTLYVGDYYNDPRNQLREQQANDDYTKNYRHSFLEMVGKAHRAGVKVVSGVDLGGYDYDPTVYVRELAVLMEAGMTAMEAIQATTSVPAEMLNQQQQIGAIEVGRKADIIAVAGDPLQDISLLEQVKFVMKNGVIVR
ncbi:MAG: amidohydrolase family protein, partial [Gammaproteobacteria bacterium]|nr:amidohydrolase family protein [Gammaproteobacteria bacterium]